MHPFRPPFMPGQPYPPYPTPYSAQPTQPTQPYPRPAPFFPPVSLLPAPAPAPAPIPLPPKSTPLDPQRSTALFVSNLPEEADDLFLQKLFAVSSL